MAKHRWKYSGDVDLRQGGFFWREDDAEDYVLAVRVTPCSDADGPDNVFHIEDGSIYMPTDPARRKCALYCIGGDLATATRDEIVYAFMAYGGLDGRSQRVVRIGPPDPFWNDRRGGGWNPAPDEILRGNCSLERYVRSEYLR